MRHVILIPLVLLASCGSKTTTKYVENPYDNSGNNARFNNIEVRLAAIERTIKEDIVTINNLSESVIDSSIKHANTIGMINLLQDQVNNNIIELAALENQNTIVEYSDPCGDSSGYDEIVLKTNKNEYIAYFESGSQRFLTKLDKNTLYQTTDFQSCVFSIDDSGNLI